MGKKASSNFNMFEDSKKKYQEALQKRREAIQNQNELVLPQPMIDKKFQNIFENEEISFENLCSLLRQKVSYQKKQDPWNEDINQIDSKTQNPAWFSKKQQNCENFPCIQRILINAQKKNYLKLVKQNEFQQINIGGGYVVDLLLNIQFHTNDYNKQRQIVFLQMPFERPAKSKRFNENPFKYKNYQQGQIQQNDQQNPQIQKFQCQNLGQQFFEENKERYPSIKQIFDGLLYEMAVELRNSSKYNETQDSIEEGINNHLQAWKYIFECFKLCVSCKEPIQESQLLNPNSQITKTLLFIHSMETFLPYCMKQAEINKDQSKVKTLGPYAFALGIITWKTQTKRQQKLNEKFVVYRGGRLNQNEFEDIKEKYKQKKRLILSGFTSTSESIDVALKFTFSKLKQGEVPVLYEIQGLDAQGYDYFKLDHKEYALFCGEKEILLYTSCPFEILEIQEKENFDHYKYQYVRLKILSCYP